MPGGYFIGLMSGTSMDGIDAALVDLSSGRPRLAAHLLHPWPEQERSALISLASGGPCDLEALGRLDAAAGERFADAALALLAGCGVQADDVLAIGSHGQTIAHSPDGAHGFTLQIGDPNRIAERTGITTVSDFRRRDIAAGGQGAPLVPAFHQAFLADPDESRAVLNIGGIANLTLLPRHGVARGFDTGPGNCLMDGWIRLQQERRYDAGGSWAATGQTHAGLLASLLEDPYFARPAPKSTGTQYFGAAWLDSRLAAWPGIAPVDVQATLAALTVHSVATALREAQPDTARLLVCGGGRQNPVMMAGLADALPGVAVQGTEDHGLDPDNLEAMAFAWLASETLAGRPGNLPSVTGANRAVVLGGVYHG